MVDVMALVCMAHEGLGDMATKVVRFGPEGSQKYSVCDECAERAVETGGAVLGEVHQ